MKYPQIEIHTQEPDADNRPPEDSPFGCLVLMLLASPIAITLVMSIARTLNP